MRLPPVAASKLDIPPPPQPSTLTPSVLPADDLHAGVLEFTVNVVKARH